MKYSIGDKFSIKKGRIRRNREDDGRLRINSFISVFAVVWILMLFVDLLYLHDLAVRVAVGISVSIMIVITCALLVMLKIRSERDLDIGIIVFAAIIIIGLFFQFSLLGNFGNLPK